MSTPSSLITIITRYHLPLERLARRILLQKERAADCVKFAMEAVYEDELFYEGPHLRSLLSQKTIDMAHGLNRAIEIHSTLYKSLVTSSPETLN